MITCTPGLIRSSQSLIPFGLPLRTRKLIVEVYGQLLFGRRFCQSSGTRSPWVCSASISAAKRQGHHVCSKPVDHGARLFSRSAMRLLDNDIFPGLGLVFLWRKLD